jgi:uncharacterized protein (DUF111 family)
MLIARSEKQTLCGPTVCGIFPFFMRDVKVPGPSEERLEAGGWLHLDATRGASGEMFLAALIDLGLDEELLPAAFAKVGLPLGARVSEGQRGELGGRRVVLVDDKGRSLLAAAAERSPTGLPPRAPGRRRRHEPHKDARPAPAKKAMGVAREGEAGSDNEGAEIFHLGPDVAPARAAPEAEGPAREEVTAWLTGAPAFADALLARLRGSELPPLAKALADKTLRRCLDALARTKRCPRAALSLEGPLGVQLLAEAVGAGALLEALSPGRVTATAVALDAASDPWVEAALEGVLANEQDLGFAPTTALGAALLWATALRFGPRGELVVGQAGTGFGPAEGRGQTNLMRALLGPLPAGATRRGGAAREGGGAFLLEALTSDLLDRPRLHAALAERGATSLVEDAASASFGPAVRLRCAVSLEELDAAVRALWREGGAAEVLVTRVERRRPLRREVTVAVGRATRKELVRLVELIDEGERLMTEVSREDLLAASRRLGVPLSVLHEEALAARAAPQGPVEEP